MSAQLYPGELRNTRKMVRSVKQDRPLLGKRFTKGQQVYWTTMFGDLMGGTVLQVRRNILVVDRTCPPGACGVWIEKEKCS